MVRQGQARQAEKEGILVWLVCSTQQQTFSMTEHKKEGLVDHDIVEKNDPTNPWYGQARPAGRQLAKANIEKETNEQNQRDLIDHPNPQTDPVNQPQRTIVYRF